VLGPTRRLAALLALGIGLSLVAAAAAGSGLRMRHPVTALGVWLAALAAAWLAGQTDRGREKDAGAGWEKSDWLAAGGLLGLGLLLRLPDLAGIPWIHSDNEASVGLGVNFMPDIRTIHSVSPGFHSLAFLICGSLIQALGAVKALRAAGLCGPSHCSPPMGWAVKCLAGVPACWRVLPGGHAVPIISAAWAEQCIVSLSVIFSWGCGGMDHGRHAFLVAGLALSLGLYPT
jgi:hypothetical protein